MFEWSRRAGALLGGFLHPYVAARHGSELEAERDQLELNAEALGRAQAALEESRNRYFALYDDAPVGYLTLDEDGTILEANRMATRWLGMPRADIGGTKLALLLADEDAQALRRHLRQAGSGRRSRCELTLARGGSRVVVQLETAASRSGGAVVLYRTVLVDITAVRRAEEQARAAHQLTERLLDTAPVVVMVLDPQGRILRFNRAFEALSGRRLDAMRGSGFVDAFVAERERMRVRRVFGEVLERGLRGTVVHKLVVDGRAERLVEWHTTALESAQGRVDGLVAVGLDVTEQRCLEASLRQTQKMEAVGRLAAGVAHDFNNVLQGIIGCADAGLQELPPTRSGHALFEQIRTVAKGGVCVTRQLLAFSRPSSAETEPVLVDRAVAIAASLLRRVLGANIQVVEDCAAVDAFVRIVPGQIEQILLNLAANARDAMPEGGELTIATALRHLDADEIVGGSVAPGPYVEIRTRDTGCGMSVETMSRAFDPFFTTKGEAGTGLGLAMVYNVVREAGGHLDVSSQLGGGTELRVLLPRIVPGDEPRREQPLAQVESASLNEPTQGDHKVRAPSQAGDGRLVLLVDDDGIGRMALKLLLERLGYRVQHAADGAAALTLVAERRASIDAMIVDVGLPDISGIEVAERARALVPQMPILFLTGRDASDEDLRTAIAQPRTALALKPIDIEALSARLSAMGPGVTRDSVIFSGHARRGPFELD